MRKLHLVGVTTDLKGLIYTARKGSKSGGYVVALDSKLLKAVDDAGRRGNGQPVNGNDSATSASGVPVPAAVPTGPPTGDGRPQSALSPREMQARLRGGRSIEEVAAEAGVGTEWVARFAVPIRAEQAQVVALARGLTFSKPRLGESSLPLGESVALNLVERGQSLPDDLFDPAWSAYQLHGSVWMVRFRHEARGRMQEALWELDVVPGRLVARGRLASDLGYVEASRRRPAEAPATDESTTEPRRKAEPARPAVAESSQPSRARSSRTGGAVAPRSTPAGKAAGRKVQAPRSAPTRAGSRAVVAKAGGTKASTAPRSGARSGAGERPRPPASPSPPRRQPGSAAMGQADGGTAPQGGAGIRAATAQVASAQVAASRDLVARSLSGARARTPSDSEARRPGPPSGSAPAADSYSGFRSRRASGSGSEHSSNPSASTASPERVAPRPTSGSSLRAVRSGTGRPASGAGAPAADFVLDDLVAEAGPPRRPKLAAPAREAPAPAGGGWDFEDEREDGVGRTPADAGGATSDADTPASMFRPRPHPLDGGQARPERRSKDATVTRVRTEAAPVHRLPAPRTSTPEPDDSASRREPVMVPPILSGASGPDRGMPEPRPRSRRLLRRSR